MAFKTKAEKKAFRAGVLYAKKKNTSDNRVENWTKSSNIDKVAARRYAEHMGFKFDISAKEVNKNTLEHYKQMKRDKDFREYLRWEYIPGYERKK